MPSAAGIFASGDAKLCLIFWHNHGKSVYILFLKIRLSKLYLYDTISEKSEEWGAVL